jgi:hypothetical protein
MLQTEGSQLASQRTVPTANEEAAAWDIFGTPAEGGGRFADWKVPTWHLGTSSAAKLALLAEGANLLPNAKQAKPGASTLLEQPPLWDLPATRGRDLAPPTKPGSKSPPAGPKLEQPPAEGPNRLGSFQEEPAQQRRSNKAGAPGWDILAAQSARGPSGLEPTSEAAQGYAEPRFSRTRSRYIIKKCRNRVFIQIDLQIPK